MGLCLRWVCRERTQLFLYIGKGRPKHWTPHNQSNEMWGKGKVHVRFSLLHCTLSTPLGESAFSFLQFLSYTTFGNFGQMCEWNLQPRWVIATARTAAERMRCENIWYILQVSSGESVCACLRVNSLRVCVFVSATYLFALSRIRTTICTCTIWVVFARANFTQFAHKTS